MKQEFTGCESLDARAKGEAWRIVHTARVVRRASANLPLAGADAVGE